MQHILVKLLGQLAAFLPSVCEIHVMGVIKHMHMEPVLPQLIVYFSSEFPDVLVVFLELIKAVWGVNTLAYANKTFFPTQRICIHVLKPLLVILLHLLNNYGKILR